MLEKLIIKNIALIENVEINFTKGLNVLSGETGAGKSVIIEALNFVLGAKADKSLIRSGEVECFVSAEFFDEKGICKDALEDIDIEPDSTIIITRKFNLDGKSTVKINGVSVTVSMLKSISSLLVDVHGQSEHFMLLSVTNQLILLDKIAFNDIKDVKEKLSSLYYEYKQILKQIDDLGGDESQRLLRLDVLNYQIKEIVDADLKEDEEDLLLDLKTKLVNQEKISINLGMAKSALSDEGGVSDILANATKALQNISSFGDNYNAVYEQLSQISSSIDDVSSDIYNLLEDVQDFSFDPDYVENRLDIIKNLKKKYGNSISEIHLFLDKAIEEKEKLNNFNETYQNLLSNKAKIEKVLYENYLELSNIRRATANEFCKNVVAELQDVGMQNAKFEIKFNEHPNLDNCKFDSNNGFDVVEFLFSANKGEPLKPMSHIISGGEMSRFMLSIKAQASKFNNINTFIFDEIDAGISGVVAKTVSQKFARISLNTQVIAITHLPQISAMADNNLLIEKIEADENTKTFVKQLTSKEKIYEIVRLIGGDISSESALNHANELMDFANQYKKNLTL